MTELQESIKKSLEAENWYAALFVALALPDICAAIENPLYYIFVVSKGGRG